MHACMLCVCVCVYRLNILQENKAAHEFGIIYQAKRETPQAAAAAPHWQRYRHWHWHCTLVSAVGIKAAVALVLAGGKKEGSGAWQFAVEVSVEFWHWQAVASWWQPQTLLQVSLVWFALALALCARSSTVALSSLLSCVFCGRSSIFHFGASTLQLRFRLQLQLWLGNYN